MTPEEKKRITIIKKTLPSVVSVIATKKIEDFQKSDPSSLFPVFEKGSSRQRFLSKKIEGPLLDFGGGSGFVVHKKGTIVTNTHVISEAFLDYTVITHAGEYLKATLIDTDPLHDIAYLSLSEKKLSPPPLSLGSAHSLELGATVYALGTVLGQFPNTVTMGIVSGLSRTLEAYNENTKKEFHGLFQIDAAINPGNSGGPIIDSEGKVVGITSAAIRHAENVAFCIPIDTIQNDLNDIIHHGSIKRAFLGVRYTLLPLSSVHDPVHVVKSPSPSVPAVIPGSPADTAGIKEGDILVSFNAKPLSSSYTLEDALEESEEGMRVSIEIVRKGKKKRVSATLQDGS